VYPRLAFAVYVEQISFGPTVRAAIDQQRFKGGGVRLRRAAANSDKPDRDRGTLGIDAVMPTPLSQPAVDDVVRAAAAESGD
jgi:hypothetical protein